MKKIIALFLMLLICVLTVSAAVPTTRGRSTIPDVVSDNIPEIEIPSKTYGLENAILRVRNESVVAHLENVLEKVQNRWRERLSNMDGLTIETDYNDDVIATGRKPAKFLGIFKLLHRYRYQIEENGEVIRKRTFFDIFWVDIENGG